VLGRFAPFRRRGFSATRSVAYRRRHDADSTIAQKTTWPPIRTGGRVLRRRCSPRPAVVVAIPGRLPDERRLASRTASCLQNVVAGPCACSCLFCYDAQIEIRLTRRLRQPSLEAM